MKKLIAIISAAALVGFLCPAIALAAEENEESVDASKVPAAVQKAADKEASGGKVVRWEKERSHYEAVIEKDGKEWGYVFDQRGKMLSKHNESKEKEEHAEKH